MHTSIIKLHSNQNILICRDEEGVCSAKDVNVHDLLSLTINDSGKVVDFVLKSDANESIIELLNEFHKDIKSTAGEYYRTFEWKKRFEEIENKLKAGTT